jgi:predicted AAA+ superfamily ATPase
VQRLPAWGKSLRARVASSPKVHVVDSGLAARLLRLTPAKLRTLEPTALTEFGNLLETFVVNELPVSLGGSIDDYEATTIEGIGTLTNRCRKPQ